MFDLLAGLLVYRVLGLAPEEPLGAALHFFVMDVTKILVLLTLVIYVMGWLRSALSPERVREFLRHRGNLSSRFMAVGLGAVTPFCSCSSVPLFIGFVEAGIPLGVTLSFLIASPMINEVAVVVLASVIGWKLTLLYVLAGLTVALVGGFVLERFRPERWVEGYVWQIRMGEVALPEPDRSLRGRHAYAVGQVKEIVGRLWKFVLIGVGVGALIHGYVPMDLLARLTGDGGLLSVVGAVLVGIPLYSDAVGVIAVAEALLGKGVPIGTVLAFMMAVAALSLPEMIILRKVVKWPLLGLFAGYLALAFILVGVLFNTMRHIA
ncbi:MAG: permease [Pseudomonadota bacterium]